MRQRTRLIINVLSNYSTIAFYGLINFILVGYIIRKIGADSFGLVMLALSLSNATDFLDRGASRALTKYVSAALSGNKYERVNEYVNTGLVWFVFCGLLGGTGLFFVANYIDSWFKIPPALVSDAHLVMKLMALKVLLCLPFNVFQGFLHACQRFDLANAAKVFVHLLQLLIVVGYYEIFGGGLIPFVVIMTIVRVMERLIWGFLSLSIAKELKFKLSAVSRKAMISLFSFGGFITIVFVANVLGYEAVKWLIGREMSILDVGGYALIATIVQLGTGLTRSISNVLMPVASKYDALQDHDINRRLALLSTRYAMIVAGGVCLLPLSLLRPFLSYWVGDEYTLQYLQQLAWAGIIIMLGQWCISTTVCLIQILSGTGKIRVPAIVTLTWALSGLGVLWYYLHWINHSLIVVALIISLARVIGAAAHMVYGTYALKISAVQILLGSVLRPAVAALAVCAVSYVLSNYLDFDTLATFIMVCILVIALYLFLVWIFVLSSSERSGIAQKFKLFLSKIRVINT